MHGWKGRAMQIEFDRGLDWLVGCVTSLILLSLMQFIYRHNFHSTDKIQIPVPVLISSNYCFPSYQTRRTQKGSFLKVYLPSKFYCLQSWIRKTCSESSSRRPERNGMTLNGMTLKHSHQQQLSTANMPAALSCAPCRQLATSHSPHFKHTAKHIRKTSSCVVLNMTNDNMMTYQISLAQTHDL